MPQPASRSRKDAVPAPRAAPGTDIAAACMSALFAIAMDPKESGSTRVAAITRLLDREIGRPAQTNPQLDRNDADTLSDEELQRIAARGRGDAAPPAGEAG